MNKAISLVVSVLVIIALIIIVGGVGLFLNSTYTTTHTTTSSTPNNTSSISIITTTIGSGTSMTSSLVSSNSSSSSWQVLKTNVIVPYDIGCTVFEAVGHTCPTKGPNTTVSSLEGVELIVYRGTDYYAGNFSEGPYGDIMTVSYRIVWFTNTTIYCTTPPEENYTACP